MFVPFVLNQQFTSRTDTTKILVGFLLFSLVATATYLFNDICDLKSDQQHPIKQRRAIASGRLPVTRAAAIATAFFGCGIIGAIFLDVHFLVILLTYSVLTATYSLKLKRFPLVDTLVIAVLFMLRIVAGMVLSQQPISMWLCSFTVALFLSLALAKRHDELTRLASTNNSVRGYVRQDLPLTLGFGVSAAMAGILILILYLNLEAETKHLYSTVSWLYGMPLVVLSWTQRVWFLANRGLLADDPVAFALRDRVSWYHGAAVGFLWIVAVLT